MKLLLLSLLTLALPLTASAAKGDTFKIDAKASKVTWEGRKLGGSHHGTLAVKGGTLDTVKGALTGGEVMIDMTTLKDVDLDDKEMNSKLVNHLKSEDFFSIEKNPTSTLKITKVEMKGPKAEITADLTIKGITKPITFPADVSVDKKHLTAKGSFEVDRTMYDIKFRSLKFFSNIGDKVIKDQFQIGFDLHASK
jgi:polyisoprenoid-binding protein YceI